MKKFIPFLLIALFALSSCNYEKRVYRDGWYRDKQKHSIDHSPTAAVTQTNHFVEESAIVAEPKDSASESPSVAPLQIDILKPYKILKARIDEPKGDDPKQDKPHKMTYAEARKSMAEKGCTPNSLVMTTYYMAWASVICIWFGFGLILIPLTLILSIFAINKAATSGDCADENLAIVAAARRICLLALLYFLIIGIIIVGIVLSIIAIANYYDQI